MRPLLAVVLLLGLAACEEPDPTTTSAYEGVQWGAQTARLVFDIDGLAPIERAWSHIPRPGDLVGLRIDTGDVEQPSSFVGIVESVAMFDDIRARDPEIVVTLRPIDTEWPFEGEEK